MPLTPIQSNADRTQKNKGASKGVETPGSGMPFDLIAYFKGVRQEWDKITWPPRERVMAETGVVLLVVAIFSLSIFLMDWVFTTLIHLMTSNVASS